MVQFMVQGVLDHSTDLTVSSKVHKKYLYLHEGEVIGRDITTMNFHLML